MTQSTEQERAEFDRLILETDGMKDTGIGWADRNPDGTYKHKQIQKHFLTWQAARRAQVVPQGWKLVPVVPTEEMLDAIDLLCDDLEAFEDSQAFWNYLIAAAPQPPECLKRENPTSNLDTTPAQMPEALLSLEVDAHYIFNNPPGECPQAVRDVIEWYAGSIRQLLADHGIK